MSDWVFVTGGCGYLGSHISAHLKTITDRSVMMIDRRGLEFPHITRYCDIFADEDFSSDLMMQAIRDCRPSTVVHCADDPSMEHGVQNPLDVWDQNVTKTIKMLRCCAMHGVKNFIFYSTSQVYSHPSGSPRLSERDPLSLPSAFSRTKYGIEMVLKDCYVAHGISSVSLRTFNVAGNHHLYDIGPLPGSPYLVPSLMDAMLHGGRLTINGRDHQTEDGTPIRDYIHVMDLADATVKLINWLPNNPGSHVMNLGTGVGHSVQGVVDLAESLFSRQIPYSYGQKKIGDPPVCVSDPTKIIDSINWKPTRTMNEILRDAFKWHNGETYRHLLDLNIRHS